MSLCGTDGQTNDEQLKIELLSQWKLEAEFRNWIKLKFLHNIVGVTLLRSSLNLTVAALWKTTLTSSSSNLTECGGKEDGEAGDGDFDGLDVYGDDPLEVLLCKSKSWDADVASERFHPAFKITPTSSHS